MKRTIGLAAWSLILVVGCQDPTGSSADSAAPDTSVVEAASSDDSAAPDTSVAETTSPEETAAPETNVMDTASPDDSTAPDTSVMETASPDDSTAPDDTLAPPNTQGYELIEAAGKSFMMGSPAGGVGQLDNEAQRRVTLTVNYWLKATEVTQREWSELMATDPSYFAGCDECPVESVSWFDAVKFMNALSESQGLTPCYEGLEACSGSPGAGCPAGELFCTGDLNCAEVVLTGLDCSGYRLPTEAEWEYAARADTTTATYAGNLSAGSDGCYEEAVVEPIAWYCDNADSTRAVGTKDPNGWGLHDMLGNVWEWVHDWYIKAPADDLGPVGPPSGEFRVFRGGSWDFSARLARAARRGAGAPDRQGRDIGFRPARSVP